MYKAKKISCLVIILLLLTGCSKKDLNQVEGAEKPMEATPSSTAQGIQYHVDPETFSLSLILENQNFVSVSLPGEVRTVENLVQNSNLTSWFYPDEEIKIQIENKSNYLSVTIDSQSTQDKNFTWPMVSDKLYYLPFGEGKRIPSDDIAWKDFLTEREYNVMEQLSMPFWSATGDGYSIVYILENPFRSTLKFNTQEQISFDLTHTYAAIDPNKSNQFRVYLTEDNPVSIAKIYKQYVQEQNKFQTLAKKAKTNPNIEKLYGAPHIYLWGDRLITPSNINWQAFRQNLSDPVMTYLKNQINQLPEGKEVVKIIDSLGAQDYVDNYQKNAICNALSNLLQESDFYASDIFTIHNNKTDAYLTQGYQNLNTSDKIQFHKQILASNLKDVFSPAEEWANDTTTDLIADFKKSGLEHAWIGLNNWTQGLAKPELVSLAVEQGYLIGPYDSYHSIHEPGKEQWNTAQFSNQTLYENATIVNWAGEKITGFKNVGRKLNPTLSMDSVKQRLDSILAPNLPFNSWFIDCDATGEIYDDYSPAHRTTQEQDLAARMERISYIRDQKTMVVGSEGGNDFASDTIAFAHGLELQSFSWMDSDMKDENSEYYMGRYYNPNGGVPESFAKPIPVKEELKTIFLNPTYEIPLYKLVYNDSIITTYHWDWSTYKIKGDENHRMLREILYNVPPLYHLDKEEWKTYKSSILSHTKVWSGFSKQAILQELTDFARLSSDGMVQMTRYGENLTVVANYSDELFNYKNQEIPPSSLLILNKGKATIYTPDFSH